MCSTPKPPKVEEKVMPPPPEPASTAKRVEKPEKEGGQKGKRKAARKGTQALRVERKSSVNTGGGAISSVAQAAARGGR